MTGGFLMSRDWFKHPVFADEPFTEREAWAWLISESAWKPHRYRAGNVLVNLKRGQIVHSIRYMATAWQWHRNKVSRFLKRLKIETMIGTDTGSGVTVITICNYDKYQLSPTIGGTTFGTLNGTAAGQQRDRKEEGNKDNKRTTDDSASAVDFHLLAKKLQDAGGESLNPISTGLEEMSYPLGWLDQGCDLDLDILPAIRARSADARPQSISSWNYFTGPVADAKARRLSPMPKGNPHAKISTGNNRTFDQEASADRISEALGLDRGH